MKKLIEKALLVLGIVCFICICCEPAEGASTKTWVIWELSWWTALAADALACWLLDRHGIINLHGDGRA